MTIFTDFFAASKECKQLFPWHATKMKIYNLGIGQYPTQTTFWGLDFWSNICHAKYQNPFCFSSLPRGNFLCRLFKCRLRYDNKQSRTNESFFCQKIYFHHTGNSQNVILFEGVKTLFAGKIFIVFTTHENQMLDHLGKLTKYRHFPTIFVSCKF